MFFFIQTSWKVFSYIIKIIFLKEWSSYNELFLFENMLIFINFNFNILIFETLLCLNIINWNYMCYMFQIYLSTKTNCLTTRACLELSYFFPYLSLWEKWSIGELGRDAEGGGGTGVTATWDSTTPPCKESGRQTETHYYLFLSRASVMFIALICVMLIIQWLVTGKRNKCCIVILQTENHHLNFLYYIHFTIKKKLDLLTER